MNEFIFFTFSFNFYIKHHLPRSTAQPVFADSGNVTTHRTGTRTFK